MLTLVRSFNVIFIIFPTAVSTVDGGHYVCILNAAAGAIVSEAEATLTVVGKW